MLVGAFAWSGEGGEFTRLRIQQTKDGWTKRTPGGSMTRREEPELNEWLNSGPRRACEEKETRQPSV